MKKDQIIIVLCLSLIAVLPTKQFAQSTNEVDSVEKKSFNQSIDKGKAKQIKTLINVNGGELVVNGESNDLTDVHFSYLDNYWNPSVSYTETPEEGKLVIKSNANFTDTKIKDKNNCTIALNNNLSYALGIEMGAGIADINLGGYNITRALLRLGVGSFEIDLSNTNIPLLKLEAGVGEAVLNLSGKRSNDLKANISAGIGELTIIVPEYIGCQLMISGFLGEISAPGFRKESKVYTNKAYEDSDVKMDFDVSGAIGSINIIQR